MVEKLSEVAPGAIETMSLRLPWPAMACGDGDGDGQSYACHTRCGRGRGNGAGETSPSRGHEDTTSRPARAEMSLGFALAPLPQASAVVYGLEYATALDATA